MTPSRCACGGSYRAQPLPSYDFSAFAGFPVRLENVPGSRCTKCGDETISGEMINVVLNHLAFEITKLPQRLNAEFARYLRKRLGITQQQLADRMDVDRVTVAKWESGATLISPHQDYILRGMLLQFFVDLGLLQANAKFMAAVRRDPPSPSAELPPAAIAHIVEQMRSGGANGSRIY